MADTLAQFTEFRSDIDIVQSIDAVPTILDVVCRTTGMGFAAVARVTEDRWVACSILDNIDFGLQPGGELPIATTFCNQVRQNGEIVVIDNVSEDGFYRGHPIPALYGFQSYISVPIRRRDGSLFGTLCAIDPAPAKLNNPQVIGMFKLFAELIASHLDSAEQLARTRRELEEAKEVGVLREQILAVLGHDLRNSVASIAAGAKLIARHSAEAKTLEIAGLLQGSVSGMTALVGNLMEFAQARLGQGARVDIETGFDLQPALDQVIAEMHSVHPARSIQGRIEIAEPVECDHNRLARLFANLVSNALRHGDPAHPVVASATTDNRKLRIEVTNKGAPIAADMLAKLFTPFYRGSSHAKAEGLGLGLYIASEIAAQHGGTLDAASDEFETRFTFTMPLRAGRS